MAKLEDQWPLSDHLRLVDHNDFLNLIRTFREANGLTQGEVADLLRTTQTTVSRWEAGTRMPTKGMRVRINQAIRDYYQDRLPIRHSDPERFSDRRDWDGKLIGSSDETLLRINEANFGFTHLRAIYIQGDGSSDQYAESMLDRVQQHILGTAAARVGIAIHYRPARIADARLMIEQGDADVFIDMQAGHVGYVPIRDIFPRIIRLVLRRDTHHKRFEGWSMFEGQAIGALRDHVIINGPDPSDNVEIKRFGDVEFMMRALMENKIAAFTTSFNALQLRAARMGMEIIQYVRDFEVTAPTFRRGIEDLADATANELRLMDASGEIDRIYAERLHWDRPALRKRAQLLRNDTETFMEKLRE